MRSTATHKGTLLRQGLASFYATGYHGTSVDAVLEQAGVPKGSFYHHFGSKEAFAVAVLQEYFGDSAERLNKWALNFDLPVPDRLLGYLQEMAAALERHGNKNGCLIGKLALELAPASEQFGALLGTMLTSWKNAVQGLLTEGQAARSIRSDVDPADMANLVLSTIQGAVLLSLANRSSEPMRAAATTVVTLVSSPAATRP